MAQHKNTRLICVGLVLIALSNIIPTQIAVAVISPELREKMRKEARAQAPEYLEIKVLSVKTKNSEVFGYYPGKRAGGSETEVNIEAKVLNIRRSQSGLKKGSVISIVYRNPSLRDVMQRIPGPEYVEVLRDGETYLAYLKSSTVKETRKKVYVPAAGAASFDAPE